MNDFSGVLIGGLVELNSASANSAVGAEVSGCPDFGRASKSVCASGRCSGIWRTLKYPLSSPEKALQGTLG